MKDIIKTFETHITTVVGDRVDISMKAGRQPYKNKSVIYVDIPYPEQLGLMDRPPYGSKKGDGTPEDKQWAEYNKVEKATQLMVINACHDEIAAAYGVPPSRLRYKFSRRAGCGCGCSPGWLPHTVQSSGKLSRLTGTGVNIWINGMNDNKRAYLDKIKADREAREAEKLIGAGI